MSYRIQIDDLVRDATPEETAEIEARISAKEAEIQRASEAAAKRKALLDRLGISEQEVKLLLG